MFVREDGKTVGYIPPREIGQRAPSTDILSETQKRASDGNLERNERDKKEVEMSLDSAHADRVAKYAAVAAEGNKNLTEG